MHEIIFPNNNDLKKMCTVAIDVFDMEGDDTQLSPTLESCLELINVDQGTFFAIKEGGEIIAWTVVLPTSKSDMNDFLSGKISEKELSVNSKKYHSFESLYLMAAIVLPGYRKQGLAKFLLENQIKYFQGKYNITDFYAWWYSEEGKRLSDSLEKSLGIEVRGIKTF